MVIKKRKKKIYGEWLPVFAWLPVEVMGQDCYAWLEKVDRLQTRHRDRDGEIYIFTSYYWHRPSSS